MENKKGGKRPNAGRKPVYVNENMIRVSGRLTREQWEALKSAGGFRAIRRIINFCLINGNDLRQFIYFNDNNKNH